MRISPIGAGHQPDEFGAQELHAVLSAENERLVPDLYAIVQTDKSRLRFSECPAKHQPCSDLQIIGSWTMQSQNTNGSFQTRQLLIRWLPVLLVGTLMLVACSSTQEQKGQVLGGVLGGALGSQVGGGRGKTVAIIVGAVAGAMIGRHIGESMDDGDRLKTATVLNDARIGESTSWVNPDTGYRYNVTPTRTYQASNGPCREFTLDATVGQKRNQDVHGNACLQADGSWQIE